MTINIDFSDTSEKENMDIWDQMSEDEREKRANEALEKALATYLTENTENEEFTTEEARVLLAQFKKSELREATLSAINREEDSDHLDRMSAELVERLDEKDIL